MSDLLLVAAVFCFVWAAVCLAGCLWVAYVIYREWRPPR